MQHSSTDSFGDRTSEQDSGRTPVTPDASKPAETISGPKVFEDKCDTCIFRPGNKMQLMPGRLKEVVESNLRKGTLLVCHKTTYGQAAEEVLCNGFFEKYGERTTAYQVFTRLGGEFERVKNDC